MMTTSAGILPSAVSSNRTHGCALAPILLVSPQYAPTIGGVERHVEELAHGLASRGFSVEVATTDPVGGFPAQEWRNGVLVRRFPTVAHNDVYFVSPELGVWLWRNARRFALLHAHSYHTPLALQALLASRHAGVPFALTTHYHGTGHTWLRRALHVPYRMLGNYLIHASQPVICVSQVEQALLRAHFGAQLKTIVVPNGVEVDKIMASKAFPKPAAETLLLSVGRLEHYKQVYHIARALPHLPNNYRLAIIGQGPARSAIADWVAQAGITGRVDMLGYVAPTDLHRWLRTADVFISMSQHEAFGITVLEAAVAGAAVVASDIPAHRELMGYLPQGRVSLLDPRSDGRQLARAIAQAAQQGRAVLDASAHVPTWTDTVEGVLAHYKAVLSVSGQESTHEHAPVFAPRA